VRQLCRVFDIFRIDHVLGLYRIYAFPWRPGRNDEFLALAPDEAAARTGGRLPRFIGRSDDTPEGRAANLTDGDERLRMIIDAAAGAEVVAEDLGTVPPYVRPHLRSLDIPGFKICHWEDDGHGHAVQGAAYDNCSFATYATHDHEPMRTFWERRRSATQSGDAAAAALAARELRFLCQFGWIHPEAGPYPPYDQGLRRALIQALLRSNARFAAILLPDLFGFEIRFNVPGLSSIDNWSARLPMTVAEMCAEDPWAEETAWLANAVATAGRAADEPAAACAPA
jgi:4-alpha-glucanotransferase